jgi:uncharacterized membrane protein YphA (DoxX/SURF4 family)
MTLTSGIAALSGLSFILFGLSCLRSNEMKREFERFGFARFRVLTGVLEVAGGAGLLIGLRYTPVLLLAALGLTVLMAIGVAIRLRVRDRALHILPALGFSLLNGYVAVEAWKLVR